MPMIVLGGEKSGGDFLITQGKMVATNVEGVLIKGSGHWLIDEAPGRSSRSWWSSSAARSGSLLFVPERILADARATRTRLATLMVHAVAERGRVAREVILLGAER